MSSFVLSDGTRTKELVFDSSDGIFLQDLTLPLVANEVTYAEAPDGEGRRPLRKRPQAPTGSVKFAISAYDSFAFWDYVDDIQDLVASMDRSETATIYYQPPEGTGVTYDVTVIQITGLPQSDNSLSSYVIEGCEITFETAPYARKDAVSIFTGETFSGPVDSVEVEDVPGHVDAWGSLTLDEASGYDRGFVEVGQAFEYETTEALYLGLPDLLLTGTGGSSTTRSGSYSTNVVQATLSTAATTICKSGSLTHIGRKRMRARVYTVSNTVQIRLAWRVGDGSYTYSPWRSVVAASTWLDVLLDIITIQRVPAGTHSWDFRIEGRTTTGTATVDVDIVSPFPADRHQVMRQIDAGLESYVSIFDNFGSISGAITGDTSTSGQTWASMAGHTDADDFTQTAAPANSVIRTAVSDTSTNIAYGRGVILGSGTPSDVEVSVDVNIAAALVNAYGGVIARFVDNNNFAVAFCSPYGIGGTAGVGAVQMVVGGVVTVLGSFDPPILPGVTGRVSLLVSSSGVWFASYNGVRIAAGFNSALATGGTLAAGKSGMIDAKWDGTACTRTYRNFNVSIPDPLQPVMFDTGSILIDHDVALRESEDGYSYGRIAGYRGKHLIVKPATRNGNKTLMAVRARRYNIDDGLVDSGLTDSLTGDLEVTPRVLLLAG